jgi:PPM family protein phosphatase
MANGRGVCYKWAKAFRPVAVSEDHRMTAPATQVHPAATLPKGAGCNPAALPRPLSVSSHGRTDVGRVRKNNEDQFLIGLISRALQVQQTSLRQPDVHYSTPQGRIFLVADGVGGNAGGEKASALAVNVIEDFVLDTLSWCMQLRAPQGDALLAEFQKALTQADDQLFDEARRRPELHGMATTLTMAYCLGRDLFVAHAGDSRCYLLRHGLLYRLTRDHTLVSELVARGVLNPEEAAESRYRHVVTNVVGGEHGVQVEVHKLPLEAGDVLLLCSDGLTEMVPDQEILAILNAESDPTAACDFLVNRAIELGGKDNVTVVVAHFDE